MVKKGKLRTVFQVAKKVVRDIGEDDVLSHAAALAFYTALSLPPLIVFVVWVLGSISEEGEQHLEAEVAGLVGKQAGELMKSILDNSDERIAGHGFSKWLGIATLLFAASGVFGQLQIALNRVWEVEAKPGGGIKAWLRKRLLSLGAVGVVAFLAAVSLIASTALAFVGSAEGIIAQVIHIVSSLVLFTGLFALVFKLLPDVKIAWKDVLAGAAITAVLFLVSKVAIGFYLAKKGVGEEYGAAGSAVMLLVWVYWSAAVVLIGAEISQAWLLARGRRLEPNEFAQRIERAEGRPVGAELQDDASRTERRSEE